MNKLILDKTPKSSLSWTRYAVFCLGALIFTATFIYRLNYITAPLANDESIYTYLGKVAMQGGIPYIDFYEMKPPLLFYIYGFVGLLFGSASGIHIASIIVTLALSLLIYKITSQKFGFEASFLSACLFFWMYSSPYIFGNYLQSEHFVNLFNLLAIFFIYQQEMNTKNIFIAGIFLGLAFLIKQTALFFLPPLIILCSIQNKSFSKFITDSLKLIGSFLVPVIIAFVVVLAAGGLKDAKFWLIDFPSEYASSTTIEDKFYFLRLFGTQIIGFQYILWAHVLCAVLVLLFRIKNRSNIYFLSFLFFSVLSIIPGFRYYGHYWLLIIPAAAICLAYLIEMALTNLSYKNIFLSIFSLLMVIQLSENSKIFFSGNPDKEISNIHYGQYHDIIKDIGIYLNKTLKPNDDLMVLGAIPQIYIYTDKIACTRHVWQPMLNYSNAKTIAMRQEMMSDLEKSKPKYVLFSFNPYHWGLKESSNDNLYTKSYRFVENNYERVAIFENTLGKIYIGNEAKSVNLQANMYVVYKLIGSS
jgi:hypothetical protein